MDKKHICMWLKSEELDERKGEVVCKLWKEKRKMLRLRKKEGEEETN